jgi:ATP-dependent Lon protease
MEDLNIVDRHLLSEIVEGDVELLPLISADEENEMNKQTIPDVLPILPLKNTVLFPGVIIPITVGRDKSLEVIKSANEGDKLIGVIAQKDSTIEEPEEQDINRIGVVAKIVKVIKMPDGNSTVILQGRRRFELQQVLMMDPFITATVKVFEEMSVDGKSNEVKAMISAVKELAISIIELSPNIPSEATIALKNIESNTFLINFIASNLNVDVVNKQLILEESDFMKKSKLILLQLQEEMQLLEIKREIQGKVDTDIENQQRQFLLHQQMKTIQDELGKTEPSDPEVKKLVERSKDKKWSESVQEAFDKEVQRLGRLNPAMPDYSVSMNYLEYLLDLPWNEFTEDDFDLKKATKVLDDHHHGLEKVKKRILEYLAVLKLKGDMKSPIICLVGAPGVGKTSLGKSIAEALGRQFVRMSLGGIHDESEVRGHRKTYIGAMPGRIVQNIKKVKSSNPVFILDEIDKIGSNQRGDPSSALLEVLDPEQNSSFYDNYLEVEYDLSKVMFIATANSLSTIQPALRDRMEIIEVNGYTVEEKIEIAKKHLIPKQRKEHGLKATDIKLTPKIIEHIIESYTRESGVRSLDKKVASIMRSTAKSVVLEEEYNKSSKVDDIKDILGATSFDKEMYNEVKVPGVAVGLAWTSVGGDILFIEVGISKGKGGLQLTGNLGDVMKESAHSALSYIKSHATDLGIDHDLFEHWNIHVHVPEGAIPKDGPSAGITMLSAMVSALTQKPLNPYFAMTGEITLRGKVLPVGGIKEKILAAKRAGISEIILCEMNRKDIEEIKQDHLKGMKFHFVKEMMDVVDLAVSKKKIKNAIDFKVKLK